MGIELWFLLFLTAFVHCMNEWSRDLDETDEAADGMPLPENVVVGNFRAREKDKKRAA